MKDCHKHSHSCDCNQEISDLKKPIMGEISEDKMLLIRDSEVIGELPIPAYESTFVFVDAFNNLIPPLS